MPCVTCKKLYMRISPCDYPQDKEIYLTKLDYHPDIYISIHGNHLENYSSEVFRGLRNNCPCVNCLVKMMCTMKGLCEIYKEFLSQYDPMLARLEKQLNNELATAVGNMPDGKNRGKMLSFRLFSIPIIMNNDITDLHHFNDFYLSYKRYIEVKNEDENPT